MPMKTKNWVLWLIVVAFLVSEIFLFSANRQKDAARVALHEATQQLNELQGELEQIKNSNADSQNAELARLRSENQELPRLRNELTQLQTANRELTRQLNTTLTAAQQQQEQVKQLTAENQQARAIFQQADIEAARNTCINHLRQIDAAKQQWALENNKPANAIPTAADIAPYLKLDANGNIPGCPSGGTYTIGAVDELPMCSIPGHTLSLSQ